MIQTQISRIVACAVLGFLLWTSGGCSPRANDVTVNADYHSGYAAGDVYELTADANVVRYGQRTRGDATRVINARQLAWTVSPVESQNGQSTVQVGGEVPSGTRVRITNLIAVRTHPRPFYWLTTVHPIGVITTGLYARTDVDLYDLSKRVVNPVPFGDIAYPFPVPQLRPVVVTDELNPIQSSTAKGHIAPATATSARGE